MHGAGCPFFKNMSFRNCNSLCYLAKFEQIEEHLKTKV